MATASGPFTPVDEFRTLNRCLDNAIADAVASFGQARQVSIDRQAQTARQSTADYIADHGRLIAIARQSFEALKTGNIGMSEPRAHCSGTP